MNCRPLRGASPPFADSLCSSLGDESPNILMSRARKVSWCDVTNAAHRLCHWQWGTQWSAQVKPFRFHRVPPKPRAGGQRSADTAFTVCPQSDLITVCLQCDRSTPPALALTPRLTRHLALPNFPATNSALPWYLPLFSAGELSLTSFPLSSSKLNPESRRARKPSGMPLPIDFNFG